MRHLLSVLSGPFTESSQIHLTAFWLFFCNWLFKIIMFLKQKAEIKSFGSETRFKLTSESFKNCFFIILNSPTSPKLKKHFNELENPFCTLWHLKYSYVHTFIYTMCIWEGGGFPQHRKPDIWKNVRAIHIPNTTNIDSSKCWSSKSGSSPAKNRIWRWPFICLNAFCIYMQIYVFWKPTACLKLWKLVRCRTQSKRTHEHTTYVNRNFISSFKKLQT